MPEFVPLWLSTEEYAVLHQIARESDLTHEATMRQALRVLQLYRAGLVVAVPSESPGCGGDD